jgi:hypothetical protein
VSAKRPSFQFYGADWLTDPELRSCSIGARGMWVDMLCIASKSQPYGHLVINGKGMTDGQIVNAIGGSSTRLLRELESSGVFSRTADGTIYSRRMVRDEETRNAQARGGELGAQHGAKGAAHGAKGGRPRKETGDKEPPSQAQDKPPSSAEPEPPSITPSSASASASFVLPTGLPTPTVEASAVDNSTPDGNKLPENQRPNGKTALPERGWHRTNEGIEKAAAMLGVKPIPGELHQPLKARLFEAIALIERQQAARA